MAGASVLAEAVADWHPDAVTERDTLHPGPCAALARLLGAADPPGQGHPLPPFWQWMFFVTWPPAADLGSDGHLRDGHFLPPIPDRRRMVAGGRLEVVDPPIIGAELLRHSRLDRVQLKSGRSGELCLVTVRHEFVQHGRVRLVEEQDFIYRSAARYLAVSTEPDPIPDATLRFELATDPVTLFLFSALTANPHRIHYDEGYCRDVEGFPERVVHGPLVVLAMLEMLRAHAPSRRVRSASYRLTRPFFAGDTVVVTSAGGEPVMRLTAGCTTSAGTAIADVTTADGAAARGHRDHR